MKLSHSKKKHRKKDLAFEFLMACKKAYHLSIFPGDPSKHSKKEYRTLARICEAYISRFGTMEFAGFLQEGQYRVQLWSAHVLLEHVDEESNLYDVCVREIKKYAESTLNAACADIQSRWIAKNLSN